METDIVGKLSIAQARERYDTEFEDDGEVRQMMRIEERWGPQVHDWIDEGVPTDAMENHLTLDRFRERRDTPIPWNVEKHNKKSLQRSREATEEIEPAGRTSVPDAVREVISSPGQPLDASIQRAVEERMGDSLGDVRIHTGAKAAAAADKIDARAFTVGNHVAFGAGEYDLESAEGQHVLAHELAHVRQQTGGALSMLPQEDVQLEIDPDPELEQEAEETARRVMSGGDLGIQCLSDTDVHVQRIEKNQMFGALALFEVENEQGDVGEFQRTQNASRIAKMREWIGEFDEATSQVDRKLADVSSQELIQDQVRTHGGTVAEERISGPENLTDNVLDHEKAKSILAKDLPSETDLVQRKQKLEDELADRLQQVATTESQRKKLGTGAERSLLGKLSEKVAFSLLTELDPGFKIISGAYEVVKKNWGLVDGDIVERAVKLREELLNETIEGEYTSDLHDYK